MAFRVLAASPISLRIKIRIISLGLQGIGGVSNTQGRGVEMRSSLIVPWCIGCAANTQRKGGGGWVC